MAKWYYFNDNDEKVGPIRGRDLKQLAQQGTVTPETRVEDENGRTALAKNVTGLTFLEATQSEAVPLESSTVLLPPSAEANPTSEAENLGEQDFEQLREDFERLQKQQDQVTQNIAAPTPPPTGDNPFTAAIPTGPNPFAPHAPGTHASIPHSVPFVDADRRSFFATVASTIKSLMSFIASMSAFALVMLLCGVVVLILCWLALLVNPQWTPDWLRNWGWNASAPYRLAHELRGHAGEEIYVRFSPDGKRIATIEQGVSVRLWDADSGREITKIAGHFHSLPTDNVLLTTDRWAVHGTPIRRWNTTTGRELLPALEMEGGWNHQAIFSPDRTRITMHAGPRGRVFVWDVESGRKLHEFARDAGTYSFSPDGTRIAVPGWDTTRILDAESGRELQTVAGDSAVFSHDSRKLATGVRQDFSTRILDVNSGRELQRLEGMPGRFFPDDRKIVTRRALQGANTAIRIWDVNTGRELQQFEEDDKGRMGSLWRTPFSPDGTKFITELEGVPGSVFIWDAETYRELHELRTNVRGFYFSHDGRHLVTYYDLANCCVQSVRVWDVNSGRELHSFAGGTRFPLQERITKVGTSSWCAECNPDRENVTFATRIPTTLICLATSLLNPMTGMNILTPLVRSPTTPAYTDQVLYFGMFSTYIKGKHKEEHTSPRMVGLSRATE